MTQVRNKMLTCFMIIMVLAIIYTMTGTVLAASSVSYVERSWSGGDSGNVTQATKECSSYQTLSSNSSGRTSLGSSWYVLHSDVTYNKCLNIAGNTKLILCDGKTLNANDGIYIQDGCTLTIYGQSNDTGKIDAKADGGGPGIGGIKNTVGGSIIIHGGTVHATGESKSAGIGGGSGEKSGMRNVTIYGGTVNANGGEYGAGIGKGQQNNTFGTVIIYGGTVNANGGKYGAGIGGGEDRGSIATKIYGGSIEAMGGQDGAGIGGGESGSATDAAIEIFGGTVHAESKKYGAGIGGGENGDGGTVRIKGGTCTVDGGMNGAGIGGGKNSDGGTVTIEGKNTELEVYGGYKAAAIGSGAHHTYGAAYGDGGKVTIKGGKDIKVIGGYNAPCIGGANLTIKITGGTIVAAHSEGYEDIGGPGIGITKEDGVLKFTMTGGNLRADGGRGDAGIGGAYEKNVTLHINISGGTINASSFIGGAGIGSGSASDTAEIEIGGNVNRGSKIEISGGTITATSNEGAGIGSGFAGNQQGTITISGGITTATGNKGGAGIGGGCEGGYNIGGNAGTIIINGGTVTATANDENNAQAIGHGARDENEGSLTISDKMCVDYEGKTASKDERVSICRHHATRVVRECGHEDNTYISTETTHTKNCIYCNTSFETVAHTMDDCNKCTVCKHQGILYTILFEAGGGSGHMKGVTVVPGNEYQLPAPEFTAPEGKAFAGWTLKTGNSEPEDKLPGETIAVTADTIATAKWDDKCLISFDKGDGSPDEDVKLMKTAQVDINSEYILPECSFTAPEGKIFKEWSVQLADGTDIGTGQPGDNVTASNHMLITAVWGDAVTVTLAPGKCVSGNDFRINVLKGSTYTLPTYEDCGFEPPKGFIFREWAVKIGSSDAVRKAAGDKIEVTADTTATATWDSNWKELQELVSKGGTVTLNDDYTATDGDSPLKISDGVTVTLDLNGHTLNTACDTDYPDHLLEIDSGGSLTLTDSGTAGGIIYESDDPDEFHIMHVSSGGSFTMSSGEIEGSGTSVYGVYLDGKDARFNMSGGRVSCTAKTCYGIYVNDESSFSMSGGKIRISRGNWNKSDLYGVYVRGRGDFSIEGDPDICSDQPDPYKVYLLGDSRIRISGPLSENALINVKQLSGGGIFTRGLAGKGTLANFAAYDPDHAVGIKESSGEAYIANAVEAAFEKGDHEASGTMTSLRVARDSVVILPECDFVGPPGIAFKEWAVWLGTSATENHQPGDSIIVKEDITVTAVWKKHEHNFAYSADSAMITATCTNTDGLTCPLTDNAVTLTILAPERTVYNGTGSINASLSGLKEFNEATGLKVSEANIYYAGRDDTVYDEDRDAPADAGKYTAKITAGGKTASVDYEIAKADPEYTIEPNTVEGALTADGSELNLIVSGTTDTGSIRYAVSYGKTLDELMEQDEPDQENLAAWSLELPTGNNAGYYIIWYYILGDSNHYNSKTFWLLKPILAKHPLDGDIPVYRLPRVNPNRAYTGNPVVLMTDPVLVPEGINFMYYCTKDSTTAEPADEQFSKDLPVGTDPGIYYVWFMVKGDGIDRLKFPKIGPIPISIDKKTVPIPPKHEDKQTPSESKTGIENAMVTGIKEKTWSGKVLKQNIVVKLSGKTLQSGRDYEVSYKNNKNVGKATLTITGKGSFIGKITKTFRINPKGASIMKLTRGKKAITVKWKMQSKKMSKSRITGYQIQIATNKNLTKKRKTLMVKGYKKTSKKVTKLKAGKKYYFRIRTYMKVSGENYYSSWSKAKRKIIGQ